jgi:hypothetical protein
MNPLPAPNTSKDFRLFMLSIRRDEDRDRFADDLLGAVALKPFSPLVKCRNHPVEVFADNCIVRGIDHGCECVVYVFEIALLLVEFC